MHRPLVLILHHRLLHLCLLHTPPLLISLVLPPVQAADEQSNGDGDGAKNCKDNGEDNVANTVVGTVCAFDETDTREECVEVRAG